MRKNRFRGAGWMVRLLFVPSSEIPPLADQVVVVKSEFCSNVQFFQDEGHDTRTLLLEEVIVSVGRLMNTESLWSLAFTQIKSTWPSPFRSAAATTCGLGLFPPLPATRLAAVANPPLRLFVITVKVLPPFMPIQSGLPSLLTSATVTELPIRKSLQLLTKAPWPSFVNTKAPLIARPTIKSTLPSPFTSAATIEEGDSVVPTHEATTKPP